MRNTLRGRFQESAKSTAPLAPRVRPGHIGSLRGGPHPPIRLPGECAVAVAFGGPDVAPENAGRAIVGQGGEVHAGLGSLGG